MRHNDEGEDIVKSFSFPLMMGTVLIASQALGQVTRSDTNVVERVARTLDRYAHEAMSSREDQENKRFLKLYFRTFPDDFEMFHQIFGYQRNSEGNVLMYPSVNHTLSGFLPKLKAVIAAEEYYEKMLGVGVGGFWEADEVNHLRHHLKEIVTENIKLSVEVLRKKDAKEITSLWYFIYDGPHPGHRLKRKHFEELYPRVRDIDPNIAGQLKLAYEQLLSEHDDNGH